MFTSDNWFSIIGFLSLPVLGLIFCCSFRTFRGWSAENRGEVLVRETLLKYCENQAAHVLSNVTLRLMDGTSTQIDHILISTKGIFVIETKHYKGWIFANPKSKAWNQSIFHEKYKFQNPLNQNYKHVKAVQNLFEFLEPQLIHNIVVFSGDAVFKTNKPDNVYYLDELIPKIEQYSEGALSLNRVQFCVGRLEFTRLALTRETDVEHQAHLRQRFGR